VGAIGRFFARDGAMTVDARLTLRTHDGALIYMTYGRSFRRSVQITGGDGRPCQTI
jgi:hypothetical protein